MDINNINPKTLNALSKGKEKSPEKECEKKNEFDEKDISGGIQAEDSAGRAAFAILSKKGNQKPENTDNKHINDRILNNPEYNSLLTKYDRGTVQEYISITRCDINGKIVTFAPDQIKDLLRRNTDLSKLKQLSQMTYTNQKGEVCPRFGINDMYELLVKDVDIEVINRLKDLKGSNDSPMLGGDEIALYSKCKDIDKVVDLLGVKVVQKGKTLRLNRYDIVDYVDKGYDVEKIKRLYNIKWGNGNTILDSVSINNLINLDIDNVEKLLSIRRKDKDDVEYCFSTKQIKELANKNADNILKMANITFNKNGVEAKRFNLASLEQLADCDVEKVQKLSQLKWNLNNSPRLKTPAIVELSKIDDIDKAIELLNIRTNFGGEEQSFGVKQVFNLMDKDLEKVKKISEIEIKRKNSDSSMKPTLEEMIALSEFDYNDISDMVTTLSKRQSEFPDWNISRLANALGRMSKQKTEVSAKHFFDMLEYYSGLTTKDGEKIFNGRNGRMNESDVLDYMASLPEVSKEATAVRMLTSLIQDGQVGAHTLKYLPSESKINPLIADDVRLFYEAYLNHIPPEDVLVPTYKSLGKSADVQVGNVFEVKGEKNIYIKNKDGTSTRLDMDKATYCKLFPPIERFSTTQNAIGNCWQINGFNTIMRDPNERRSVLECIKQDGDDIVIQFPNGKLDEIRFKNGELPEGADKKFYSEGALGINLLEFAQACEMQKTVIDTKISKIQDKMQNIKNPEHKKYWETQIEKLKSAYDSDPNNFFIKENNGLFNTTYSFGHSKGDYDFGITRFRNGGRSNWTWDLLGYKNAADYLFRTHDCRKFLSNPESFNKCIVGWISDGQGEQNVRQGKGIVSGHAYWLRANTDEQGSISDYSIVNPWGIVESKLSIEEVMQYGKGIYIADRKYS